MTGRWSVLSFVDTYKKIATTRGGSRDAVLAREKDAIRNRIVTSLSYHKAVVNDTERELAIISTDITDTKTVCSMPGEDFRAGSLVVFGGEHWIITERDSDNEVYTRGKMRRCNYLLKWVDKATKQIVERWCIVEDATKYLYGEWSDNDLIVTRGDTRLYVTIAKDQYTSKLEREDRFIIDDEDADTPLTYRLTKPLKTGFIYGDSDVFCFIMMECASEDDDNPTLRIANYYKYYTASGTLIQSQAGTGTGTGDDDDEEESSEPAATNGRGLYI